MAAPIEMPFGLRTWVGPKNQVFQIPHGNGQFWGVKEHPIVKYRDTLRSSVQIRLNRSRCRLGCGLGWAVWVVLDADPAVLRYVTMATNFGTQFAVTGFVGYNFGCILPASVRDTNTSLCFRKLPKAFLFVWLPRRHWRWTGALKWTHLT